MILFSIGLPCRLTEWCDNVVRVVAAKRLGPVHLALVDTPDELAVDLIRSGASHVVAASRKPGTRLRSALAETHARFLLVLSDPRQAVADLMLNHGCDLVFAVKFVANSCSCIMQFARLDGALVFNADRHDQDAAAMVGMIAAHFGVDCPADDIAAVAAAHPKPSPQTESVIEEWWNGLGADGQSMVHGALAGFSEFQLTGSPGASVWERGLFLTGDEPHESATRAIDVTGRPRCLLFGPYIVLPPGSWIATLTVGFSKELAGSAFNVELWAGAKLGNIRLQPTREQVMQASLDFVIEDHTEHAVEIQVYSERAAFDGRLVLGSVAVTPQSHSQIGNEQLLAEIARAKVDAVA